MTTAWFTTTTFLRRSNTVMAMSKLNRRTFLVATSSYSVVFNARFYWEFLWIFFISLIFSFNFLDPDRWLLLSLALLFTSGLIWIYSQVCSRFTDVACPCVGAWNDVSVSKTRVLRLFLGGLLSITTWFGEWLFTFAIRPQLSCNRCISCKSGVLV